MNAFKTTTPLVALAALLALAGCDRREEAAITPAPGSTASAPGMAGDSGAMTPPPGSGASDPPMTSPAIKPGASAPP